MYPPHPDNVLDIVPIQMSTSAGIDAALLGDAASGRAEHAERVRFVDHQPGVVAIPQLDQTREVRDVAVHAVQAFNDDEAVFVFVAERIEQLFEGIQVVVRERTACGARQLARRRARCCE